MRPMRVIVSAWPYYHITMSHFSPGRSSSWPYGHITIGVSMQRGSKVSDESKEKFRKTVTIDYLASLDDDTFYQFVNERISQRYNKIKREKGK